MTPIRIEASISDIIEFNGRIICEHKWSSLHFSFSAHIVAYETDTNKIVIVCNEWNDEHIKHAEVPNSIQYSVLDKTKLEKYRDDGKLVRFLFGNRARNRIEEAVRDSINFYTLPARDFARLISSKLGFDPNVTRSI